MLQLFKNSKFSFSLKSSLAGVIEVMSEDNDDSGHSFVRGKAE